MTVATRRETHYVVEEGENDVLILTPLKDWLRLHPEYKPDDRDPVWWHTYTLVTHLRRLGFVVWENAICIVPPE